MSELPSNRGKRTIIVTRGFSNYKGSSPTNYACWEAKRKLNRRRLLQQFPESIEVFLSVREILGALLWPLWLRIVGTLLRPIEATIEEKSGIS